MPLNLTELTSRVHHHGYARGVVVMDPSDFDALIYEIETLRSRLNDLQEVAVGGLRRARSVDDRVKWIGQYFQSRDKPKVLCKVVDYGMKSEKFYITLHYPDGSTFYQQAELSYDEIVQYYNMDNPVIPKPHFMERT